MKKGFWALTLFTLMFIVGGAHAEPYLIRFSHVVASDTPKGRAANLFKQLVEQRLQGKVSVEVYPNSKLYDDDDVLTTMLLNNNDKAGIMAAPSLSKFLKFSRELQIFDLPFLFRNIDDVHRVVDSPIAGRLTVSLENKGIKALVFWDNGMKVFSVQGDKPLRSVPDDFEGKIFRVQNSNVHAAMIEALGGIPQRMPFKQVYLSLKQGTVDGEENTWSNIYTQKFHQVQDWITVSNHAYLGYLVVVSDRFWSNLPADIRSELETILKEVTAANRQFADEVNAECRSNVEKSDYARLIELTPKELESWRQATRPVIEQFEQANGTELLAAIHNLLAE